MYPIAFAIQHACRGGVTFSDPTVRHFGSDKPRIAYWLLYAFIILTVFAAAFLLLISDWALDAFGTLTIQMVIFHIRMPMQGAETSQVADAVRHALIPSLLFTIVFTLLTAFVNRIRRNLCLSLRVKCVRRVRLRDLVPSLIVALSFLLSSAILVNDQFEITNYLRDQRSQSAFIEDHYADPNRTILTFPDQKRNLIHILMESMEAAYSDQDSGGFFDVNYIPELTNLAESHLSFSNTDRLGGFLPSANTQWTIAGMFAQSAGLSLTIPIDGNSMSDYVKFFPGVTSLGDILDNAGYQNVLMLGSDAVFGGRRQYYEQHGNYRILDYPFARENGLIPEDYHVWWGFEDARLYDLAKDELLRLAASGVPFNFTLLTADTHFEDGYVCGLCPDAHEDQYANVLACASRQIADFVAWIQEQDFFKNTTLVITGDHQTMDSDFFEQHDAEKPRPIYNAFINAVPAVDNPDFLLKDRLFTPFDIFPTTLSAMGVKIEGDRLALGTDLFSGQLTLAETYGLEPLTIALSQNSVFFNSKLFYGR